MPDLQSQAAANMPSTSPIVSSADTSGGDALSHLAKMSGTGSAFGQADYVAISPVAISALVLGMLSLLSLVFPLFLVAAGFAVFIGLFGIYKIRQSNGTQSGVVLALAGILISLLVGGGVAAREAREWSRTREHTKKCAEVLARFGEEVKAHHYEQAYNTLMTGSFRDKFDFARFRNTMQEVQSYPDAGALESLRLNDQPIKFEPIVDSDARKGTTYALIKFAKIAEPGREPCILDDTEGEWKIQSLPRLFYDKKKRQPQP